MFLLISEVNKLSRDHLVCVLSTSEPLTSCSFGFSLVFFLFLWNNLHVESFVDVTVDVSPKLPLQGGCCQSALWSIPWLADISINFLFVWCQNWPITPPLPRVLVCEVWVQLFVGSDPGVAGSTSCRFRTWAAAVGAAVVWELRGVSITLVLILTLMHVMKHHTLKLPTVSTCFTNPPTNHCQALIVCSLAAGASSDWRRLRVCSRPPR